MSPLESRRRTPHGPAHYGIAPWLSSERRRPTSGTGSTNVIFSFDANAVYPPRSGTLTVGGQTVTITQAGSTYCPRITIVHPDIGRAESTERNRGGRTGNGGIVDTINNAIKKWTLANNTVTKLATVVAFHRRWQQ